MFVRPHGFMKTSALSYVPNPVGTRTAQNTYGGFISQDVAWLQNRTMNKFSAVWIDTNSPPTGSSYSGAIMNIGSSSNFIAIGQGSSNWFYHRSVTVIAGGVQMFQKNTPTSQLNNTAGFNLCYHLFSFDLDIGVMCWYIVKENGNEYNNSVACGTGTLTFVPGYQTSGFSVAAQSYQTSQVFGGPNVGGIGWIGFNDTYLDFSDSAVRRGIFGVGAGTTGVYAPGADASSIWGTQPAFFTFDGDARENVGRVDFPNDATVQSTIEHNATYLKAPPLLT